MQDRIDVSPREAALIEALQRIVLETMPYSPKRPHSTDSYLPTGLVHAAQAALAYYDADVAPIKPTESWQ
jgi:hypothetical protein